MSSRQLLGLIAEFPEHSKYREAAERTIRVVEDPDGGVHLFGSAGALPEWATEVASYVDWTYDRKIAARLVCEVAAMRADTTGDAPDFTGLREPLKQLLIDREHASRARVRAGASGVIRAGLYGNNNSHDERR